VRDSAQLLAGSVQRYVFVSTVSVYADQGRNSREDAPLATTADESVEEVNGTTYGPLKVLCERAVQDCFPERALIIRPGLIVGPHDPTVRFSYWTGRVARGGKVLAPGDPNGAVEFIDVRDLAEWTVRMVEDSRTGTFNAAGPAYRLTMAAFLEQCRLAAASDARVTWLAEDFLLDQGVEPWTELPLWIPGPREPTVIEKALAAGLTFRPLAQTVSDTLAWQHERQGRPLPAKPGVPMPNVTLTAERERQLLEGWRRSAPVSSA
jgi:2'-hydroxyisoflavone reductase